MQKPIFSVAICTYNRAQILKISLESILSQSLSESLFEIIVMDDGSNDKTVSLLADYQKKYKIPQIRFFSSKNIGLAYSRNKAVLKANGKYVCFMDDDAKADKFWLENALKCLNKITPRPQGLTGPIFTYYNSFKPLWFKNAYEEDLKGKSSRFLKKGEAFSGPNMILKKDFIKQNGGFAEEIDMKGDILMVGEETKFFERVWEKNPHTDLLYYSTDVKVFHLVHPYKMKLGYRLKRWFASGQSYYFRSRSSSILNNLYFFLKVSAYFFYSALILFISIFRYRYIQNWVIERIGPLGFALGFYSASMKIPFRMKSSARL